METDNVKQIKIDDAGRLCIYPEKQEFILIFRTATEVNLDIKGGFLYSPKPREWSYFDWYKHIVGIAKNDCSCDLLLTDATIWINIPLDLREQISAK